MRWKAKIEDPGGCITLQRIVSTFSRLGRSRECRLRLAPDKLYLIECGDSAESNKIWCEVEQAALFQTFKIESLHSNNEILLQINVEQLSRALKSTVTATAVTFKLSKRDDVNFLSLVIGSTSVIGNSRPITQDIPISIMHHNQIDEIQPPALQTPEVNIYLPTSKVLKNVVERMKVLSDNISICANESGDLNLKVETSIVTVKTFFKDLRNALWKDGTASSQRSVHANDKFVNATIPVKSFYAFIAAHQPDSTDILLSIVQGKTVVLSVIHEESTLTLYVPVFDDR